MEARRCGRPTKSGKPCQAILSHRRERACGRHATSEDQAYAQGWTDGEAVGRQGWQDAKETAKSEVRWEIENQIRREKAAEERRNFRTEVGGKRIVSVDIGGSRPFAYTWGGDPLAVGDRVLLPGNWLHRNPFEGKVVEMGSSYQDAMVDVLRKLS